MTGWPRALQHNWVDTNIPVLQNYDTQLGPFFVWGGGWGTPFLASFNGICFFGGGVTSKPRVTPQSSILFVFFFGGGVRYLKKRKEDRFQLKLSKAGSSPSPMDFPPSQPDRSETVDPSGPQAVGLQDAQLLRIHLPASGLSTSRRFSLPIGSVFRCFALCRSRARLGRRWVWGAFVCFVFFLQILAVQWIWISTTKPRTAMERLAGEMRHGTQALVPLKETTSWNEPNLWSP